MFGELTNFFFIFSLKKARRERRRRVGAASEVFRITISTMEGRGAGNKREGKNSTQSNTFF